jgi:alkanesulfonate monooxygenase
LAFPDLATRISLLSEQLEIIVQAWSGEKKSFLGAHYQLEAFRRLPRPLQRPRPPIIVGGAAKSRSLELAVRFADEYNSFLIPIEECARRRQLLDNACRRAGRDPARIRHSLMTTCLLGSDRTQVQTRLRETREARADYHPVGKSQAPNGSESWLVGTVDETVDQLTALAAVGFERVYLHHPLPSDVEMVNLLGNEVVPAVSVARR